MDEADKAVLAAANLGFTGKNVYYYDLESCDTTNTTCRNAVKAFIDGWVYRIRSYWGEKAGVYGSACGSAVSDWASIANPPDSVWIAAWNGVKSVWNLPCVSNTLWANHQRLHQWRGGHNETWGGVTLNIDSDCADGLVTPHGHSCSDPECTQ